MHAQAPWRVTRQRAGVCCRHHHSSTPLQHCRRAACSFCATCVQPVDKLRASSGAMRCCPCTPHVATDTSHPISTGCLSSCEALRCCQDINADRAWLWQVPRTLAHHECAFWGAALGVSTQLCAWRGSCGPGGPNLRCRSALDCVIPCLLTGVSHDSPSLHPVLLQGGCRCKPL